MYDDDDTKPLPPYVEEEPERRELSPKEKIHQAISLAREELKVADGNENQLKEIERIIEQNWDMISTLVQYRLPSDYDSEAVQEMVKRFFNECGHLGLPVFTVDKSEMPDPTEKGENFGQLDILSGAWVLKFDSDFLAHKIQIGDRSVTDELVHEFLAWRLFSGGWDEPDLNHKTIKNKKILVKSIIPLKKPSILQTHFFDVVFEKLVFLSR